MTIKITIQQMMGIFAAVFLFTVSMTNSVNAHCDTMNGPVIKDARYAIEKRDVTPVLKWVKKEHEEEIKAIFQKTMSVRTKGVDAKEIADKLFFETLVRIHRAGEGVPFTGLKESEVEHSIQDADKSIENGNADVLIKSLTKEIEHQVRTKFDHVMKTRKTMNQSVEAGREYVEKYVQYVHFIEQLGIIGDVQHGAESKEGEGHLH